MREMFVQTCSFTKNEHAIRCRVTGAGAVMTDQVISASEGHQFGEFEVEVRRTETISHFVKSRRLLERHLKIRGEHRRADILTMQTIIVGLNKYKNNARIFRVDHKINFSIESSVFST